MNSPYELIIKVGREKVRIATQGGGEKSADFKIDELTERILDIFEVWLRKGKITEDEELAVLGSILYQAIFVGGVKELFEQKLAENEQKRKAAEKSDERLRIALVFDKEASKWARLPWEFLYYPKENLALATKASLVLLRHTPTENDRETFTPPVDTLKVLIVVVQPDELIRDSISQDITKYKTDFDSIAKEIQRLTDSPKLAKVNVLDELRNPTIADFASALNQHQPHVVHYIGYGRYLEEGEIAFLHTGKEKAEWVKKSAFADCFQGIPPRLVFLQLCEGPQKETSSGDYLKANFAELAPELILKYVPAIIAMRYPVDPEVASKFTQTFYKTLAEGKSVATAVQEGRRWSTIGGKKMRNIGSPVLFMHSQDGLLLPLTEITETSGAQSSTSSSLGPASTLFPAASQSLSEATPPEFSFDELAQVGFEAADSVSLRGAEVYKEIDKLRKAFNQDVDKARQMIIERAQSLSLTDPTGKLTTVFVTMASHLRSPR
jgi:CHAT domain-containing protein